MISINSIDKKPLKNESKFLENDLTQDYYLRMIITLIT